jgi:hypothetical protein
MKRILLTKGGEALVDDQDHDYLSRWKWYAAKGGKYAARDTRSSNRRRGTLIYMHDVVAARIGMVGTIDHANRDTLDNQRHNLRPATGSQNGANRGPQVNNTSGYKGVTWDKARHRWSASIKVRGQRKNLGRFDNKIEAARAYNQAALKHFGVFAFLNPV